MNAGALIRYVSPGPSVSFVVFARQPSMFVNPSARFISTISVALSFTEISTDLNGIKPVFFNLISTHQLPLQLSRLAYSALKAGDGVEVAVAVGVGGGVNAGKSKTGPVSVAYFPHTQQNSGSESGLRIYQ